MRYKIIDIRTNKPVGPFYFNSLTKAQNYFNNCGVDKEHCKLVPVTDLELKSTIDYYDKALMDLYHEIEITKNEKDLLRLINILKDVLKKRRKVKNKSRGISSSIMISDYRYRTSILEDYGFLEEEEIYNW